MFCVVMFQVFSITQNAQGHNSRDGSSSGAAAGGRRLSAGVKRLVAAHVGSVAAVAAACVAGCFFTTGTDRRLIRQGNLPLFYVFCEEHSLTCAGCSSFFVVLRSSACVAFHALRRWDVRGRTPASAVHMLPATASALAASPPSLSCVAVGFADGKVAVYRLPSSAFSTFAASSSSSSFAELPLAEIAMLRIHDSTSAADPSAAVACLAYSPDGRWLACGTQSAVVDLFSVDRGYRPHARLRGHAHALRSLDWSSDSSLLQTSDRGRELLCWSAVKGQQVVEAAATLAANTAWAAWTSSLGFPAMGLWQHPGESGDAVRAVHRSPDARFLAAANGDGQVGN